MSWNESVAQAVPRNGADRAEELQGTSRAVKSRELDRASGEDGDNGMGRILGGTGSYIM